MDFLPLYFDLRGRDCLVVGGGAVALRKSELLRQAGAHIHVVAPTIDPDLAALAAQTGSVRRQPYASECLDGMALVVAATDSVAVNRQVAADAKARQLPVNVVNAPAASSFIFPAIIDRSPVIVAVSSGGQAPVLARLLRGRLESLIPAAYGNLAKLAGRFREQVKQRFATLNQRRRFWEEVLQGPAAEMMLAGKEAQAEAWLQRHLAGVDTQGETGEVYLVGAGPGDPDLLTFRALRLMQQADVVLYDRLVAPEILELTRRDAERINVGKARAKHRVPQEEINQLLVTLARQGKRVLRLKGGDPFIFGRGGEEIDQLAQAGIPFQVVPGITAASGCAAYAGIPLTHRDYSQSVRFVTGHLKDGTANLPWSELIAPNQTLVFYMGLVGLPVICAQLIAHGIDPDTPIALVQQGTTRNQKTYIGTLADMPERIAKVKVEPPTLIIVGEVVRLHDQLAWFEPEEAASSIGFSRPEGD